MADHDDAAERAAVAAIAQQKDIVGKLDIMTAGTGPNATVKKLPALIDSYASTFKRVADMDAEQFKLVNGPMAETGKLCR
jgi:hypothetical protein